jgi:MYXO-CTERM domain-containing protein
MDYNDAASALGIGAIVLIALSFWRRRRPVVIVPVNPSVL